MEHRRSTGGQEEHRRRTGGAQEHRRSTGAQEEDRRKAGEAREEHGRSTVATVTRQKEAEQKCPASPRVFPSHQHVTYRCRALKGPLGKSKQGQSSARLHLPSFHPGWKLLGTARDNVMICVLWSPAVPSDLLPAWPPEPSEKPFFPTPCRLLKTLVYINSFSFNYLSLNFFCSSTTHRKASSFPAIPPRSKTSDTIFMCTL